jgi:hypothetical protein
MVDEWVGCRFSERASDDRPVADAILQGEETRMASAAITWIWKVPFPEKPMEQPPLQPP